MSFIVTLIRTRARVLTIEMTPYNLLKDSLGNCEIVNGFGSGSRLHAGLASENVATLLKESILTWERVKWIW